MPSFNVAAKRQPEADVLTEAQKGHICFEGARLVEQPIEGIHHVTAIASDPQRNLDFFTEVLGLRLVKRTVNFDDPGTYHFYFGDEVGTPGTILTFFRLA